jgi:hypothetical protein
MAAAGHGSKVEKTEVLTANYPISDDGLSATLFE